MVDTKPDTSFESPHVSFSNSVYQNPHTTLPIDAFYKYVQAGHWRHQIDALRFGVGKKERLPAIKVSGVFEGGKSTQHLTSHSGRIQIDIDADGLPDGMSADDCKILLAGDSYIEFAAFSPSGTGVKAVAKIPTDDHLGSFHALAAYFLKGYGITIDASTKDVSRWCYVTYDPTAHINLDSKVFSEQTPVATPEQLAQLSQHLPQIDSSSPRVKSYVESAIESEIAKISGAVIGTRNRTTLNAALSLFSLVKSPQFEQEVTHSGIASAIRYAWWDTHQDTPAHRKELEKLLAWAWDKAIARPPLDIPNGEHAPIPTLDIVCPNTEVQGWRCDESSCQQCKHMRLVKLIAALKVEKQNDTLFIHYESHQTYSTAIASSRQRIKRQGNRLRYLALPQRDNVIIIHNDKMVGGEQVGNSGEMFNYLQSVELWTKDDRRHRRSADFGSNWSQLYKGDGRTDRKQPQQAIDALLQEIDRDLYEIALARVVANDQISLTLVDKITGERREKIYSVNIHYARHEIGRSLPDLYLHHQTRCKCQKCRLYQQLFEIENEHKDTQIETEPTF